MATTVANAVAHIRDVALDVDPGVVWPVEEVVRWLSDAQMAVVAFLPASLIQYDDSAGLTVNTPYQSLNERLSSGSGVQRGGKISFSASGHEAIRILEVVSSIAAIGNSRLQMALRADLDRSYPRWPRDCVPLVDGSNAFTSGAMSAPRVEASNYASNNRLVSPSVFKYWAMDDPAARWFYIWPSASTGALNVRLRYVKQPAILSVSSLSANMEVPDIHMPLVYDWALSRLFSKEGQDPRRSQAHYERFMAQISARYEDNSEDAPQRDEFARSARHLTVEEEADMRGQA